MNPHHRITEAQSRLLDFARRHRTSCNILSKGEHCTCLLCDIDFLANKARQYGQELRTSGKLRVDCDLLQKSLREVVEALRAPAAEYIPAMGQAMGIAINALEDQ